MGLRLKLCEEYDSEFKILILQSSDILRRPKKFETIFHFVLTLVDIQWLHGQERIG